MPTRLIEFKEFKKYPGGFCWVYCLKSLKKPSICLQGMTPSAPSVSSFSLYPIQWPPDSCQTTNVKENNWQRKVFWGGTDIQLYENYKKAKLGHNKNRESSFHALHEPLGGQQGMGVNKSSYGGTVRVWGGEMGWHDQCTEVALNTPSNHWSSLLYE